MNYLTGTGLYSQCECSTIVVLFEIHNSVAWNDEYYEAAEQFWSEF